MQLLRMQRFRWLYASGAATDSYINRQNDSFAEIRPARFTVPDGFQREVLRTTQSSSQLCLRRMILGVRFDCPVQR